MTFAMFTGFSGNESLTTECHDSRVCDGAFDARYNDLGGETVQEWGTRCISENKVFDWTIGGPYRLTFDDQNVLVDIAHRRSGCVAKVPADLNICKAYKFVNPSSELGATLKLSAPKTYKCANFFPVSLENGPQSVVLDKKIKVLKSLIAKGIAESRNPVTTTASDQHPEKVTLKDHGREKTLANLEKAREQLLDRPAKRARVLDFEDLPTAAGELADGEVAEGTVPLQ